MIGDALKVSIQTGSNDDETWYYMPRDVRGHHTTVWCNLFNATRNGCIEGGKTYQFSSLIHQYDVHILEGHIVPLQNAWALNISTSAELSQHKTDLHIHAKCDYLHTTNLTGCSATGLFTGTVTFETVMTMSRAINATNFTIQFTNDLIG
jgi:hypothetical protein